MSSFTELLLADCTQSQFVARSKKRLLEEIAERFASHSDLSADDLFERLIERERLGSTGLGAGVALPHCRLPGLKTPLIALFSLRQGIDFDAPDRQPVDLVVALVAPEEDRDLHLDLLAQIAERFSNTNYRERLRRCGEHETLWRAAISTPPQDDDAQAAAGA